MLQGVHQALISNADILLTNYEFFSSKGLLELLPILFPHSLITDSSLLPLRLQFMPLVSQHHTQCLIREWELRTAGKRRALCEHAEVVTRRVAELIGEAATRSVLHSFPSALHTESFCFVHRSHELSQQLYKAEATQRMPADCLGVRIASGDYLRSKSLDSRAEFAAERGIRHVAEILQLSLFNRRLHQGRTTSMAEKLEEALANLARTLASVRIMTTQWSSRESLLQILIRRCWPTVGVTKLQHEITEHPEKGRTAGLIAALLDVLCELTGQRQGVEEALIQHALGVQ